MADMRSEKKTMKDAWQLGIGGLRAAYAQGNAYPVAVVEQHFARIAKFDPTLKAFIGLDRDRALADAAASAQRYDDDQQLPLDGIPVAVKANIAVKGLEWNAGMAARSGMIAQEDAAIVTQLREAGAIILGTLNMHEAALGATTDNPFFGRAINPHAAGYSPGGSSGGSAAAVAAGLCVAAIGTDTLGSIRIPAAWCGVYGLKPSHGAISMQGVVPLSAKLDAVGPITRSMEDLSYLTNILVKPDLSSAMQRSRFFVLDNLGGVTPDESVQAAFDFVLEQLLPEKPSTLALTYDCGRVRLGGFVQATRDLLAELVALGPDRFERLSPELMRTIEFVVSRDEDDIAEDERVVRKTFGELILALGSNGLLLLPTAPQTAFRQGEKPPTNVADWTALANVAGLPALTIPVSRDANGLPTGLQIIGPPGSEALLVAQARMINERIKGYLPPADYW
jgi:aspartyl-tRNA(Asn)/glutamyl-tRNA(Gln) amidotransferase subunit A